MKKERTDFDALRNEIEAAERRVAREIEPGPRALVVAILVVVLLGSFILPHTGSVRGWDVLFSSHGAGAAAVALPSRVFAWLALVFGVGFSMLALITRRWGLAWIALAGSAIGSAAGLLAVWSRTVVQLAAEEQRRRMAAQQQSMTLLDSLQTETDEAAETDKPDDPED